MGARSIVLLDARNWLLPSGSVDPVKARLHNRLCSCDQDYAITLSAMIVTARIDFWLIFKHTISAANNIRILLAALQILEG